MIYDLFLVLVIQIKKLNHRIKKKKVYNSYYLVYNGKIFFQTVRYLSYVRIYLPFFKYALTQKLCKVILIYSFYIKMCPK